MDTANDLRIAFYEALLGRLDKLVRSGTIRDKEGVVRKLLSLFREMKYSYLDPKTLIEQYGERVRELAERLPTTEGKVGRFVEYVREELLDFERKFSRTVSKPYQVFRYELVEIISVSPHPTLERLKVARVKGKGAYTVITNLDVRERERAAIVFLPPREFDGIWSEAMFVRVGIRGVEDLREEDFEEVNRQFYELLHSNR